MLKFRSGEERCQNYVAKFHSVPHPLMPSRPVDARQAIPPLVRDLAASIRSAWEGLPDLRPLPVDNGLVHIEGRLDGENLLISNELLCCRGVRKIHLELAQLGRGLQILHCVWFPDPCFDLPIFGADIVAGPAGVSAAIVDLSPVSGELPQAIDSALTQRHRPSFRQSRDLPGWGTIFSPHVCFIRPDGSDEELLFQQQVEAFLAVLRTSVIDAVDDPADAASTIRRYEGQLNYCLQQKRNDKTRRVLEKAFDADWADRYIERILFDNPDRPG